VEWAAESSEWRLDVLRMNDGARDPRSRRRSRLRRKIGTEEVFVARNFVTYDPFKIPARSADIVGECSPCNGRSGERDLVLIK